jgi:hypothetical protein
LEVDDPHERQGAAAQVREKGIRGGPQVN